MFRGKIILISLFIIFLGFVLVANLVHIREKDYERYESLISSSGVSQDQIKKNFVSHQLRERITKDFWYHDNEGEILRLSVQYDKSEITLSFDRGKPKILENMVNVTLVMQEDLYYLMPDGKRVIKDRNGEFYIVENNERKSLADEATSPQAYQKVRYMKGAEALYDYQRKIFYIEDASFRIFDLPGHEFVEDFNSEEPSVYGKARKIELNIGSDKVDFKAEYIKLEILDSGGWL